MSEGHRLAEECAAKGNPPCDHPLVLEEKLDNGYPTGEEICTKCGEVGPKGTLKSRSS